jgi:hypothetical protein
MRLPVITVQPIILLKNNKLIADAVAPNLRGLIAIKTKMVIIIAAYNWNSSLSRPIMQKPVQGMFLRVPLFIVIPPVPFKPGNVPKLPLGKEYAYKVVPGTVEGVPEVVVGEDEVLEEGLEELDELDEVELVELLVVVVDVVVEQLVEVIDTEYSCVVSIIVLSLISELLETHI